MCYRNHKLCVVLHQNIYISKENVAFGKVLKNKDGEYIAPDHSGSHK